MSISTRAIRLLAAWLVLVFTAGCDQATKHLARANLGPHDSVVLPSGLVAFTLTENPGAFLGLGASLPEAARGGLFTTGVALGLTLLLTYLVRVQRLRWLSFLGLALIWAGGMSNLLDRVVRHGLVTDFILIRIGPLHTGIFNVADLAIVAGLAVLVGAIGPHPWQRRGQLPNEDSGE